MHVPKSSLRSVWDGLSTLIEALSVPVILTIGSIRLLMTSAYLTLEYHKPDFPPDPFGLTLTDRLHYAPFAVHYLTSGAPTSALGDLTFPNGTPFYTPHELAHMVDVQHVTQAAFLVGLLCALALIVIGVITWRTIDGRRRLRLSLRWGATFTLGLIGIVAFGVFFAWDTFFTGFHELFFSSGSWTFEYSDSLIRLFPVQFWQDAAITIGGAAALGSALILLGTIWWGRRAVKYVPGEVAIPASADKAIRQW